MRRLMHRLKQNRGLFALLVLLSAMIMFFSLEGRAHAAPDVTYGSIDSDGKYSVLVDGWPALKEAIAMIEVSPTEEIGAGTGKYCKSVSITLTGNVTVGDDFYYSTGGASISKNAFYVGKNVTIAGAYRISNFPQVQVVDGGVLTVDATIFDSKNQKSPPARMDQSSVLVTRNGKLYLKGGAEIISPKNALEVTEPDAYAEINNAALKSDDYPVYVSSSGTVDILNMSNESGKGTALYVATNGIANIRNAELTARCGAEVRGGTLNLYTGTITSKDLQVGSVPERLSAIFVTNGNGNVGGKVNIIGGTVDGQNGPGIILDGSASVVKITGGKITGKDRGIQVIRGALDVNSAGNEVISCSNGPGISTSGGTTNLVGGVVKGEGYGLLLESIGPTVTINGGTVTPNSVTASGTAAIMIRDGTLNILAGQVEGGEFGVLAQGGSTTVSGGTTYGFTSAIQSNGSHKVVINGGKVGEQGNAPQGNSVNGIEAIGANTVITVNDGTVYGRNAAILMSNGKLDVTGGHIFGMPPVNDDANHYNGDAIKTESGHVTITITGNNTIVRGRGAKGSGIYIRNATLTITGGEFSGINAGLDAKNAIITEITGTTVRPVSFSILPENTSANPGVALSLMDLTRPVTLTRVTANGSRGNNNHNPGPALEATGSSTQVTLDTCSMKGGDGLSGVNTIMASPALIAVSNAVITVSGGAISSGDTSGQFGILAYEELSGGQVFANGTIRLYHVTGNGSETELLKTSTIELARGVAGSEALVRVRVTPSDVFLPRITASNNAVEMKGALTGNNSIVTITPDPGSGSGYKDYMIYPVKGGSDTITASIPGIVKTSTSFKMKVTQKASNLLIIPSVNTVNESATMSFTAEINDPKVTDQDIQWTLAYTPASGITNPVIPQFNVGKVSVPGSVDGAHAVGIKVTMIAGTPGSVVITATSNNPDPSIPAENYTDTVTIPIVAKATPTPKATTTSSATPTPSTSGTPTPTPWWLQSQSPATTIYITLTPPPGNSTTNQQYPDIIGTAIVNVRETWLNVRDEPSTVGRVIGSLMRGDLVDILDQFGSWYRVRTPAGITGWVYGAYLSFNGELDPLPERTQSDPSDPAINTDPAQPADPGWQAPGILGQVHARNYLNVRGNPSLDGAIVGNLVDSETIDIVDSQGEWYYIEYPDGLTGYSHANYVEILSGNVRVPNTGGGVMAANKRGGAEIAGCTAANLRAGPSVNYEILAILKSGDAVNVNDRNGDWAKVSTSNGQSGYIHSQYIKMH